ncbi:dihydrodipicolinate synthase family protein [Roseospira marina]|uniref:Dihydrodipicolinate synthase family protein n=1 Tax=Roseospira marina TaxID=140057 RepID=A0A5M6IH02_9PROT|nr:dihydrodipicolinate synthase family protein [Roseospira marina]KAA5607580.1 dihydrodipicolinate synthase family protein [Roseospira marina]MBB4312228.1 4-hydroxy-tetrahydrodipicolinate synthase [Roseospira marina]MBB5085756.1 4-hydroxy-tetrahydrodipicolinate synthase [Roseospira marina]
MSVRIGRDTRGVYIISATPFTESGALDLDSLDRLIDFYLEKGVDGITVLGMMGEADKLTPEERRTVLDRVLARAGRDVPVVAGVSDPGLANLADLGKYAMDKGAAGVMVAPARGPIKDERIVGYMRQVCAALGPDVPVVYQDFPQSTGVPVSTRAILEMTRELPQIVMLKHEDCPGLPKITALRASETDGAPRLSILCGNGGLYLPQELGRGADGAMTGFAYPEALVETVRLHAAGDADAAEDLFDCYLPLLRHEQQLGAGLALRKHVLMRRGVIASATLRAPAGGLGAVDIAELERLMGRTERRLKER